MLNGEGACLACMRNRNRQKRRGGLKVYGEPESPSEGGVFKIYDEPA